MESTLSCLRVFPPWCARENTKQLWSNTLKECSPYALRFGTFRVYVLPIFAFETAMNRLICGKCNHPKPLHDLTWFHSDRIPPKILPDIGESKYWVYHADSQEILNDIFSDFLPSLDRWRCQKFFCEVEGVQSDCWPRRRRRRRRRFVRIKLLIFSIKNICNSHQLQEHGAYQLLDFDGGGKR